MDLEDDPFDLAHLAPSELGKVHINDDTLGTPRMLIRNTFIFSVFTIKGLLSFLKSTQSLETRHPLRGLCSC